MLNNHFPAVFAALAALTAPANAAEQVAVVSRGIAPTGEREFGAKLLVCDTCHGAKGLPQNATIPVMARRAVGEGVMSCPRAGCEKSTSPGSLSSGASRKIIS
jgi:hypothetical protein